MGKLGNSQCPQAAGISEYEKKRFKILQYNATRMKEAYGDNSLADKILNARAGAFSNHVMMNAEISEDESEEDDDEYEPEDNNKEDSQFQVEFKGKNHGKKQILQQTLPMAEFAISRSQKMHTLEKEKTQHRQNSQLSQNRSQVRSLDQERRQRNTNGNKQQQLQSTKKSVNIKYCSPGSLTAFRNMRQRKHQAERPIGHFDCEVDDVEEDDDTISQLENDVEAEFLRGGNHLVSNEESRMNNLTDMVHQDHIPIENDSITPSDSVAKVKKHRGPTTMIEVHRRTLAEREMIYLNGNGQPIGPNKQVVTKFSRFLGTIAKSPNFVPLNCVSWRYVPGKEKMWEYVKERYMIDEEGKKWVLATINALWRAHKSRLKEKYFNAYETDEERLANKPEKIPLVQYKELIAYWNTDLAKEISTNNKRSREMQDDVHTMGPSSFALLREEMQKEVPINQPLSQTMVYKKSRKRAPDRAYKTKNEKFTRNIEKMDAMLLSNTENGDGSNSKDPYCEVITNGRLRLFGRSVTKSKLKDMEKDKRPSYILPPELLESIKTDLVQQVAPDLIPLLVSKIQAANPRVELNIPDITMCSEDVSHTIHCPPTEKSQDLTHQNNTNS